MSILLVMVHVIVCIALIMIVLLQTGKGADMGASFGGGGSQTLFGSTGASTFLGKATTIAAIVFMLTSLVLAYVSSHRTGTSVMDDVAVPIEEKAKSEPAAGQSETEKPAESATEPAVNPEKAEETTGSATEVATEPAASQPVAPVASPSGSAETGKTEEAPASATTGQDEPSASQPVEPVANPPGQTEETPQN